MHSWDELEVVQRVNLKLAFSQHKTSPVFCLLSSVFTIKCTKHSFFLLLRTQTPDPGLPTAAGLPNHKPPHLRFFAEADAIDVDAATHAAGRDAQGGDALVGIAVVYGAQIMAMQVA